MIFLALIQAPCIFAQSEQEISKVVIENADRSITQIEKKEPVNYLKGNVRAIQDSVFMFCDSAILKKNVLRATGNVIIIQDDTIQIFADSLYYNGNNKTAELFNNVVLKNGDRQLFTESMIYMLDERQALFRDTCILAKSSLRMSSLKARYDVNTNLAYFYEEVTVIDDSLKLKSDSMMYDTDIDRAYFIAPSYIERNGSRIYCEDGFYDIVDERAYFSGNPVYFKDDQLARAENMFYNGKDSLTILSGNAYVKDSSSFAKAEIISLNDITDDIILDGDAYYEEDSKTITGPRIIYNTKSKDVELPGRSVIRHEKGIIEGDTSSYIKSIDEGYVRGFAIYTDTVEQRVLESDRFFYKEENQYFKATRDKRRPLLKQLIEDDTLYFSADTIVNAISKDSFNYMQAVRQVKIFKSDLQAICDSLYYSEKDSVMHLHGNPVVWSDTTQFTADTIMLVLRDGEVRQIIARSSGFIASMDLPGYYNQIKGKYIHAYLDSNTLRRMDVEGNSESLYLLKDEDDAYVGPNKTLCQRMRFYFENQELSRIVYYSEPESKLTPFGQAGESEFRLKGFSWHEKIRPSSWKSVLSSDVQVAVSRKKPEDEFEERVDEIIKSERKQKRSKR